MLYAKIKAK